jgi:hypothetical protein
MLSKKDSFLQAVTLLKQKQEQLQQHDDTFGSKAQDTYMANTQNWLLIHATGYAPQNNKLQTTGHATNYAVPRATIHFTLNHTVTPNSGGSWNTRPYIILAPYEDTIKTNNMKPVEVSWYDTFFVPDPDKDLQIPASARIVRPGSVPEGKLFQITKKETIYKADDYSDEEIEEILSLMSKDDRIQYEHWFTGGQKHQDIMGTNQETLAHDIIAEDYTGRLKKIYEKTKDKRAFLIGLLEESRYEMLTQFVRNIATRMTMENMGYKKTNSNVAETVQDVAIANKIPSANTGQAGHSNSFYGGTEDRWQFLENIRDLFVKQIGNLDDLSEEISLTLLNRDHIEFGRAILNSIIYGKPVSKATIYNEFVSEFENFKSFGTTEAKTISEFDKNLDTVIRKHCEWRANNFQETFQKLKKHPDFSKMITRLKNDFANVIDPDPSLQMLNSHDR